ncbi:MAG: sugar transferase [Candidatus Baltobacteraceae bacterium]|jgi:lipopolysaccharide/colanic/teichoic acid biosynthesis glycosyltransferase
MTRRGNTLLPVDGVAVLPSAGRARARHIPAAWQDIKRAMDVTIGGAALLLFSPVVLLAAAGIVVVSPGSPFFEQERVGKDRRTFKMYKLRTMVHGAHLRHDEMQKLNEVDGPVLKIRNDPRLHALGKFLRRTSIDELPNLINVLRGEMSLVGPRPPLPAEVAHYDELAMRRLTVKPGITCLWQVSGRSNVSFDEWMKLDNLYIETWSPLVDLRILVKTIPAVLRGEGAH